MTTPAPAAPRDPGPTPASAAALGSAYGLTRTAADVMARLGHAPSEEAARFLDPKLSHLTSPNGMVDREAATDRIARAIRSGESVAVFGDYDCDGITAAAVMTSVIRSLGGSATPLLATRTEGAYGFSSPALARVKATGATLLITCDCGSSDHPRLDDARRAGIDAVVIDHHLVPDDPLPVLAFLNPHRPECAFPYKHLASCGLALSLGAALRQHLKKELDLRPLLDLVAIGTIADVAPLSGDNRALVRAGLRVLGGGGRVGLRALAELAKLDLSQGVTSEDVGYRIAPRLNAPGRLGVPDPALELLLCRDRVAAAGIAASIEQIQLARRALQAEMVTEAESDLVGPFSDLPGVVLARQGWHPGVVGIIAGRIAETTSKPTIVIGLEGETGRGSVRGPRGFPLHDALTLCRATLRGYGGHQAAAGVHVDASRVEALREAWSEACRTLSAGRSFASRYEPLARLDPADDPVKVQQDFDRLEPFGEANPSPLLLVGGAVVEGARDLKGHLKLDLVIGDRRMSGIAFSMGHLITGLSGSRVDLVATLRKDTYRGGVELTVQRIFPLIG